MSSSAQPVRIHPTIKVMNIKPLLHCWVVPTALLLSSATIVYAIDSDGDGLDDSVETNTGIYVSPTNSGTDPNNADTDGDGVPDGLEIKENTNPIDATRFHSFSKGLILYYPFDGDCRDLSGMANHGNQPAGSGFTMDRQGQQSAAIEVTRAQLVSSTRGLGIAGNSACSVSLWFRTKSEPIWPNGFLVSFGTRDIGRMFAPLYNPWPNYGNTTNFDLDAFYASAEITYALWSVNEQWTNMIVTYEGNLGNIKIYVNGKTSKLHLSEQDASFQCNWIDSQFWVNGTLGSPNGIDGSFDDVRVYNRALTMSESLSLYYQELGDVDRDGILDRYETNTGVYVSQVDTGTNPNSSDTDNDGLPDGVEIFTHGTNPNLADSDGDGFDDNFELTTGFDPKSDTSTPDTLSSIRTAVEFRFNAAGSVNYRVEVSENLSDWSTIETNIIGPGGGGVVTRFYSIENVAKRYFRARRN